MLHSKKGLKTWLKQKKKLKKITEKTHDAQITT